MPREYLLNKSVSMILATWHAAEARWNCNPDTQTNKQEREKNCTQWTYQTEMTVKREKERKKEVNETRAASTTSILFSEKGRKSYISLSINALDAVSGVFEQLFTFCFFQCISSSLYGYFAYIFAWYILHIYLSSLHRLACMKMTMVNNLNFV